MVSTATNSPASSTPPTATEVDTKKVTGRRTVHYDTYDDLLAEAERLAATQVRTLGNWSYGQILDHMGKACCSMIDGNNFMLPAPLRWVMRLLMKKKMLTQTLSPGFKIPKAAEAALPDAVSVEQGLERLRAGVARAKQESKRSPHPAFGELTRPEWDAFQLRHCEMHMSFVIPQE